MRESVMSLRLRSTGLLPPALNSWASLKSRVLVMTVAFSSPLHRIFTAALVMVFTLWLSSTCLPQSGRLKAGAPANIASDGRYAQALYEEANNYISRKYEEFNREKISFDPKLEAATRQEQKDLAARH